MNVNDKFNFGMYKGLTLKEVYQGTSAINTIFFNSFLQNCLNDITVPKSNVFSLFKISFFEKTIIIIPQIFDENKPESINNLVSLGNISSELEMYFNHFFKKNWFGIIENIAQFNQGKHVIGGNPEYILWCVNNIENFNIDLKTLRILELFKVYKLNGIRIKSKSKNVYKYVTNVEEFFFKFNL